MQIDFVDNIATNDGGALQFLNGNHVTCIECTVSGTLVVSLWTKLPFEEI